MRFFFCPGSTSAQPEPVPCQQQTLIAIDVEALLGGPAIGTRGSIERVTNKVFLLSPANVDVGAAARAQLAEDGFFNQS